MHNVSPLAVIERAESVLYASENRLANTQVT
jgi:hypothetical protein